MYTQCSSMNLRLPMTSYVDGTVSCDHSLTCEFALSPSSQLLYESEPLQDQCVVHSRVQPEGPKLETGVISPSVEGLTFNDYDVLSYMFANEQALPAAAAAAAVPSVGDDVISNTATKYLSDTWKMTDSGPTLTQLNTDDLEATLLDDFSVSSSGFCPHMSSLDCSQLIAVKPMISNCSSVHSTAATLSSWSEVRQQHDEMVEQQRQQLMSRLLSSQQQSRPSHSQASASSSSVSTSTTQLSLDRNWEAIESFLKSEDERMAAEASNHQCQQLHVAANIKSETPGIVHFYHLA